MELVLTSRRSVLTPSDREYAQRQLRFAVGRFANRVLRVALTLDDVNGPRGGVDKYVRLVITLRRGDPIAISGIAASAREAIDFAAERAKRAVSRQLGKFRARRISAGLRGLQPIGV